MSSTKSYLTQTGGNSDAVSTINNQGIPLSASVPKASGDDDQYVSNGSIDSESGVCDTEGNFLYSQDKKAEIASKLI